MKTDIEDFLAREQTLKPKSIVGILRSHVAIKFMFSPLQCNSGTDLQKEQGRTRHCEGCNYFCPHYSIAFRVKLCTLSWVRVTSVLSPSSDSRVKQRHCSLDNPGITVRFPGASRDVPLLDQMANEARPAFLMSTVVFVSWGHRRDARLTVHLCLWRG